MESTSNKIPVVAQISDDDVFEQPQTQNGAGPVGCEPHTNLSAITRLHTGQEKGENNSVTAFARCEKGQKARDHYRSSGYGTGSSETASTSSISKAFMSHSQDASPGDSSDVPQNIVPHNKVSQKNTLPKNIVPQSNVPHSIVAESNQAPVHNMNQASNCLENDFKPKIVRTCPPVSNILGRSVVSNVVAQNFMTPSLTHQACSNSVMPPAPLFVRNSDNMGNSCLLPSHAFSAGPVATTCTDVVMEPKFSETMQQSSVNCHLGLNKSTNQAQKDYSLTKQSLDQSLMKNDNKSETRIHQTAAINTSQRSLLQETIGRNSPVGVDSRSNSDLQPSHQHHVNGSMNGNHPQMVVSNNDLVSASKNTGGFSTNVSSKHVSPNVSKSCISQNVKPKPPFLRQNGLQFQNSASGSLECLQENGNDLKPVIEVDDSANRVKIEADPIDHIHTVGSSQFSHDLSQESSFYLSGQTSAMNSSFEFQFDNNLLEVLENIARCQEVDCDNTDCVKVKKLMTPLQDVRQQVPNLMEPHLILLKTMLHHASTCSHPKCPFVGCGNMLDNDDQFKRTNSLEDNMHLMKQRIENYTRNWQLCKSSLKSYMKLNSSLPWGSMPLEGRDWQRLCMLGPSRQTVLALPLTSDLDPDYSYWVIKKMVTSDNYNQWSVYSTLQGIQHKNIATMLWAAEFDSHLLVCSLFENLSLTNYIRAEPFQQLGLITILTIMQQLMSATRHLNSLGIVYLYWMSKNIMVASQVSGEFHVKVCNFSRSVLLDNYDDGHLSLVLPPAITPPELREQDRVELASDVWGLGCLLNELVTGKPIWHEHRHLLDENLLVLICKNPVPDIPKRYPELLPLFEACWEIDWTKRRSVEDLDAVLFKAC